MTHRVFRDGGSLTANGEHRTVVQTLGSRGAVEKISVNDRNQ